VTDGARINFEDKVCKDSKHNPKTFWKYVNSRVKKHNRLSCIQDSNNVLHYDDASKATLLNDYFASVFVLDDDNSMHLNSTDTNIGVVSIFFTELHIVKMIDKLNISKAAGPDGVHAKVVKECSGIFAHIFYIIFHKSLVEGVLPTQWKVANVRALHKKGKKSLCSNYRPVSLTSIICKLLESIIRDVILMFLESNHLISMCQYGFRPGYSCNTQLLEVMEDFTTYMDASDDFDCIYLDFAKAFDRVSHSKLLWKLSNIGINGKILIWIENFLSERKQRVMVNDVKSNWVPVTSGIPQGSVLGPILFTIFINDLPISLTSHIKIFADDTKIYNTTTNTQHIQDDLNLLLQWSQMWLLPFNVDKCGIIHYGKHNTHISYKLGDKDISSNNLIKDLGVIFQDDLSFKEHINKIVASANSKLGIIRNTFHEITKDNFIVLYKSFVRPILEYCCTTWAPHFVMFHNDIEKVQRRATKLVKGIAHLPYSDRLKKLNLTTLYYRRQRADMLQVYRIINNIDRIDKDTIFEFNKRPSRGNSLKIVKPRALTSFKQYNFSHRIINNWNELPNKVVLADSLNSFKNELEKHWSKKVYKYEMIFTTVFD